MKFSELWLREWVNPALSSEQLTEQITMAGLEVDGIEPVADQFSGVVIGEVVECGQHPNADKLRVTRVNVGTEHLLDIVCGAPNCRQGLKVAVAMVGALLPGDFKIKPAKLRGEPSEGMLCSFSELGIDMEGDGIIELPADAPVGQNLREYLTLDDSTIDISVTPNRADCLGILGLAREVTVMNGMTLTSAEDTRVRISTERMIAIDIQAPAACPRYLGRVITNINIQAPTPLWMQEKLRRSGIRSMDAVVDITNYVLLELGQPMHAFDLDRLGDGIIVRQAKDGETLTLLGGHEVILGEDVLVIADQQKPIAMAGIFGGESSGIGADSRNILLECAYFSPLAIIGRARRYGLHTEASHRYERGVDPALQYRAIERATRLLLEICGGEAGPVIDKTSASDLPVAVQITLRRHKLDRLIGHHIEDQQVTAILTALGCHITRLEQGWNVVAPSWRFDMQIEEDLIEEVARVFGYNHIPDVPVKASLVMPEHRESKLSLQRVKSLLADRGYQEAITYSFVDPGTQSLLHPRQPSLVLPSPISADMSVMRLSLWSGLLNAVVYNQNRQQNRVRLFESGLRFVPDNEALLGIRQEMMLAGVICGARYEEHWLLEDQNVDFYDLKGDLESLLDLTGKGEQLSFRRASHDALHPGQSAEIWLSETFIGVIGVIHPQLERKLDLNGRTVVFELLWDKIAARQLPAARPVSRFPANRRDIAVVVTETVNAGDILAECRKVGANQLVGVNLFDVYRGKGVSEGFKSLAISLILQDTTRTLEEEDIAATVANCVAALKERFQATLRD